MWKRGNGEWRESGCWTIANIMCDRDEGSCTGDRVEENTSERGVNYGKVSQAMEKTNAVLS